MKDFWRLARKILSFYAPGPLPRLFFLVKFEHSLISDDQGAPNTPYLSSTSPLKTIILSVRYNSTNLPTIQLNVSALFKQK